MYHSLLIYSSIFSIYWKISSVQFSSVAQSCPTLCDSMDCSTLVLPVHHQLPEITQTHVHWVGDAIQLYLNYFQVNKGVLNFHVQNSLWHKFLTPLDKYQGPWLLDHMMRACLGFKGLPKCLSKWLHNFPFSQAMNKGFCGSISLSAFAIVSVLNFGHSN